MSRLPNRLLLVLPLALSLLGLMATLGTGCEIAVNLNAPLDGSVSDALDCSVCTDVPRDATYDAPDASVK